MADPNTLLVLLSLALCVVYCFVALRWTRGLHLPLRRLTRSSLLALLCPTIITQNDDTAYGPILYFLTFGISGLKWGDIERLAIQALVAWGILYGLWLVVIGSPSFYSANPNRRRIVRLVAIVFSFASWISTSALVYYWLNVTPASPEKPLVLDLLFSVLCCASVFGGLISMTLVLFSMHEDRTIPSDILWTLWAAGPVALVMFLGVWLWFNGAFDYYS